MSALLVTLHVLICLALVIVVLLHSGKGAEVGAVFGGGQAMFGGEGPANFMNKLTSAVAIGFMITSLALALVSAHRGGASVVGTEEAAPITETAAPTSQEDLDKAMEALKQKAAETATSPAPASPEGAPATQAPLAAEPGPAATAPETAMPATPEGAPAE
jgi:preprotein translocase subunit SecG